ncbi:hypothetical protein [Microbulbifer sp. S227A]|uniref:hypothetical protein n=1 Tax=Microbulbifer sp. S227A TaxID=3415131 RepID=UPI003C7CBC97
MTTLSITGHGPSRLSSFFAAVKRGFITYAESRSRMDQINRLNAKSDAELAAMGITREDIVRYVFRDYMHV